MSVDARVSRRGWKIVDRGSKIADANPWSADFSPPASQINLPPAEKIHRQDAKSAKEIEDRGLWIVDEKAPPNNQ